MKYFPQVIAPTNAEILPPLPEPEAGELKKHLKQVPHVTSAVPHILLSVYVFLLCQNSPTNQWDSWLLGVFCRHLS